MSDVLALYRIQELELNLIDRTKRIKAIDAQLADDLALQKAEAAYNAAETEYDGVAKLAKEVETQIAAIEEKRESSETRLYGGEVQNVKELQDIQLEVEALGRRKGDLDDQMLLITKDRDDNKQKFDEAEAKLKDVRQTSEAENTELLSEKQSLTDQVNEMLADRRTAVKAVPTDQFNSYNRMRKLKSNRPISVLNDDACTICGIEQNHIVITAINRKQGIVNCQNCGRMLIRL